VLQDIPQNGAEDLDEQIRGGENQAGGRKGMTFSEAGSRTRGLGYRQPEVITASIGGSRVTD